MRERRERERAEREREASSSSSSSSFSLFNLSPLSSSSLYCCCNQWSDQNRSLVLMLSRSKRFRETQMGAPKISPSLFGDGAVGLRIVAAMSGDAVESGRKAKSDPIPIRATRLGPAAVKLKEEEREDEDDDVELSESYTCVISRVGGGAVTKRVYLDDGLGVDVVIDGIGGKFEMNSGVYFESPAAAGGPIPGDFLSCCYLCRKKLHGLDIFMYRGDKAFCSVECRYQQILHDEHKEKCQSEAGKPHDSPLSPYLASFPLDAGVAAA